MKVISFFGPFNFALRNFMPVFLVDLLLFSVFAIVRSRPASPATQSNHADRISTVINGAWGSLLIISVFIWYVAGAGIFSYLVFSGPGFIFSGIGTAFP